jgi:hypothetical protein
MNLGDNGGRRRRELNWWPLVSNWLKTWLLQNLLQAHWVCFEERLMLVAPLERYRRPRFAINASAVCQRHFRTHWVRFVAGFRLSCDLDLGGSTACCLQSGWKKISFERAGICANSKTARWFMRTSIVDVPESPTLSAVERLTGEISTHGLSSNCFNLFFWHRKRNC